MNESDLKEFLSEKPNISEVSLKKIHDGFRTTCYLLKSNNRPFFVKQFQTKSFSLDNRKNANFFENELLGIKELNKINSESILTPTLIYKNNSLNILVLEYVEGIDVLKNILDSKETLFYELGVFLAKFHNLNFINKEKKGITILHGDLSDHNMKFVNEKFFLFDPNVRKGYYYEDVVKFLISFMPATFLFKPSRIKNKLFVLRSTFLKGYFSVSKFEPNKSLLIKKLIQKLEKEKLYLSNKPSYLLKKFIINRLINIQIKRIKNGKIKIFE